MDILRDELLIVYADRDVELLRQREYEPFEPQPMFRWNEQEGRYFHDEGNLHRGPMTIHEQLDNYWLQVRQAARAAAMALLADEAEMRADNDAETPYKEYLLAATSLSWEQGSNTLHEIRSIIAP